MFKVYQSHCLEGSFPLFFTEVQRPHTIHAERLAHWVERCPRIGTEDAGRGIMFVEVGEEVPIFVGEFHGPNSVLEPQKTKPVICKI